MAAILSEDEQYRAFVTRIKEKIPFEPGNYEYVSARVRAKKAALYPADTYPRLLQMEIPQIARFLGEGGYKEEVLALGARLRGVDLIERATADNLAKVFTRIIEISEGRLRIMVAMYLDRWDVANIKTILRAKVYGASAAEVEEDLVAAGSLDASFLHALLEKETVDEVFKALEGTIYGEARRQMGDSFDPAKDRASYEDALAHIYYRHLLDSIQPRTEPSRLFNEFVRREIDILNIKTLLRVWRAKASFAHDVFLDGGLELKTDDLREMSALDLPALVARLSSYSFYEEIATALKEIEAKGVAHVERTLEKFHLKAASRYSHIHPLSVLPVLDFLARKTREVENIRIIARGKEHGIGTDAIKELLVI
ncbi:MAG: ATP synthase A1 subunit C [Methanobacteriota archaeon]|nr:MAG: ATP synthase A1 subunit C [Euryarchaeota archaeon]